MRSLAREYLLDPKIVAELARDEQALLRRRHEAENNQDDGGHPNPGRRDDGVRHVLVEQYTRCPWGCYETRSIRAAMP